ncbi:hypothetical protein [Enterobacter mori]|uniref:hypothetical protein n=1 Tax=Enterobacter mori TaxID=539813 RepID=UPI002A803ED7|nr:hypothetical protein [Enterobacter mori]
MDSNISELVKLGHERADELKAACGAVDVRSVAQLISDLASHLEVQYVRAEESQREFRSADATIENMQMQLEKVAAENAGLKAVDMWMNADEVGGSAADKAIENGATPEEATRAGVQAVIESIKTPATDAFLAEVRASAIEHAAAERWGSGYVFDELNEFADQLRKGVQS